MSLCGMNYYKFSTPNDKTTSLKKKIDFTIINYLKKGREKVKDCKKLSNKYTKNWKYLYPNNTITKKCMNEKDRERELNPQTVILVPANNLAKCSF